MWIDPPFSLRTRRRSASVFRKIVAHSRFWSRRDSHLVLSSHGDLNPRTLRTRISVEKNLRAVPDFVTARISSYEVMVPFVTIVVQDRSASQLDAILDEFRPAGRPDGSAEQKTDQSPHEWPPFFIDPPVTSLLTHKIIRNLTTGQAWVYNTCNWIRSTRRHMAVFLLSPLSPESTVLLK